MASEPMPVVACPKDRTGVERAQQRHIDADAELTAGRPALAAKTFGEVAEAYPECSSYHERRRMALELALDAHEAAYQADGQWSHRKAALAQIEPYLESLRTVYGENAVHTTGYRSLTKRSTALRLVMPAEPSPPPELKTIDAVDLPPRRQPVNTPKKPPGKPWRGLAIGGGLVIGGGAALLGVAIASTTRGNLAGIAGVLGSSVLLGGGISLAGVAARRRSSQMMLAPVLHPRFVGMSLQGHF